MIIETIIDGKRFASIELAGKQTIQDLKYEIILLKGITAEATQTIVAN